MSTHVLKCIPLEHGGMQGLGSAHVCGVGTPLVPPNHASRRRLNICSLLGALTPWNAEESFVYIAGGDREHGAQADHSNDP
jgi:hypothetical protein